MKNKGFTMVELLVALGISSIVIGLIFSFFMGSFKGYEISKNSSELQYQSQYILNYMAEKIVNSKNISLVMADSTTGYSITANRNAKVKYPVKKISFKYGNENENYVFHIVDNNIRYGVGGKNIQPTVELGNYVDGMFISLLKDESFSNCKSFKITIIMKKNEQVYEAFQAISMRNH